MISRNYANNISEVFFLVVCENRGYHGLINQHVNVKPTFFNGCIMKYKTSKVILGCVWKGYPQIKHVGSW